MSNSYSPLIHRFSEKQFRKYEKIINHAVLQFPNTTSAKDLPGSLETHTARIRDAMNSVLENKFPTMIDLNLLQNIRNDIKVWHDGTKLFLGRGRQFTETTQFSAGQTHSTRTSLTNPSSEIVNAICLLLNHSILDGAAFDITFPDENLLRLIVAKYPNVILDKTDTGFTLI
jgi:hypothetical protein